MDQAVLASPTTTTTTQLTINCISHCTFANDKALTCNIAISYQGNLLWTTMTNSTETSQTLSSDIHSGPVILKANSQINENIVGNMVIVTFTGVIVDSGSENKITGREIGNYPISAG